MTNPPTPQMPKPQHYYHSVLYGPMHGWSSEGGTTTIEQFAQEMADRVEELEKALREIKIETFQCSVKATERLRRIRSLIQDTLTNPGEKGAEG